PCQPSIPFFPYTTLFRSHEGRGFGNNDTFAVKPCFGKPRKKRLVLIKPSRKVVRNMISKPKPRVMTRGLILRPGIPKPYDQTYRSEEHTSEFQSRFDLVC